MGVMRKGLVVLSVVTSLLMIGVGLALDFAHGLIFLGLIPASTAVAILFGGKARGLRGEAPIKDPNHEVTIK